jgi:hypothetical protein
MKKIFLAAFAISTIVTLSSCRKQKDTVANIYVRNETNATVEGAMVVLFGVNTTNIPNIVNVFDTAYTNTQGIAYFNFNKIYKAGQAGVAVLDIKAQKLNRIGQGIIKIEPEMMNEETVFIQP